MFRSTIETRTKADAGKDIENWFKNAKSKCFPESSTAEKPVVEKQIHSVAKYEEVDLIEYQKKNKIIKSNPESVNSLLLLNAICLVLLFFYIKHLNARINNLLEA